MQLFGFCPRVMTCVGRCVGFVRWRQKTMGCGRVGKKRDAKKTTKGRRGAVNENSPLKCRL
jgi:hypothetical protein